MLAEAQQLATGKKNRKSVPKSMRNDKNPKEGEEKTKEKEADNDGDKLLENLNHLDLLEVIRPV